MRQFGPGVSRSGPRLFPRSKHTGRPSGIGPKRSRQSSKLMAFARRTTLRGKRHPRKS